MHALRDRNAQIIKLSDDHRIKSLEMDVSILRNGVYPQGVNAQEIEKEMMESHKISDAPLSTTELLTFNTFFEKHPEKVCGQQVVTSSREFPITIKGNRADVESAIDKELSPEPDEIEALALETELDLFSI